MGKKHGSGNSRGDRGSGGSGGSGGHGQDRATARQADEAEQSSDRRLNNHVQAGPEDCSQAQVAEECRRLCHLLSAEHAQLDGHAQPGAAAAVFGDDSAMGSDSVRHVLASDGAQFPVSTVARSPACVRAVERAIGDGEDGGWQCQERGTTSWHGNGSDSGLGAGAGAGASGPVVCAAADCSVLGHGAASASEGNVHVRHSSHGLHRPMAVQASVQLLPAISQPASHRAPAPATAATAAAAPTAGRATEAAAPAAPAAAAAAAAIGSGGLSPVERSMAAALKGFLIGAGLKGGLALFGLVVRLRKKGVGNGGARSSAPLVAAGGRAAREAGGAAAVSAASAVAAMVEETVRYGLFVGTFAGTYCCIDEGIAAVLGDKRTAKWRALVAGAAAGPSLLLTGLRTRHTSLALYVLVRAAVLAVRCGIKSRRWGWLFRPLTFQHGDTLLMCLSSMQILSAWLLEPSSLPPSYVSFLNKHGGKPAPLVKGVGELALRGRVSESSAVEIANALSQATTKQTARRCQSAGVACGSAKGVGARESVPSVGAHGGWAAAAAAAAAGGGAGAAVTSLAAAGLEAARAMGAAGGEDKGMVAKLASLSIPCDFLHPGQACAAHFFSFLRSAYLRAIPVYVPVYLVPALVVHRAAWLRRPLAIFGKAAVGAARSSLFLGVYCSSAWLWTCLLHQLCGVCSTSTVALGTFPAGLAVLLEKKSRRMELALYCASRAIESFFICLHRWGWLPSVSTSPVPAASAAASAAAAAGRYTQGVGSPALPSLSMSPAMGRGTDRSSSLLHHNGHLLQQQGGGLVGPVLDSLILSAAACVIMHCYANEREVFRSKYLNVLDWVFGVPATAAASTKSQPHLHLKPALELDRHAVVTSSSSSSSCSGVCLPADFASASTACVQTASMCAEITSDRQ